MKMTLIKLFSLIILILFNFSSKAFAENKINWNDSKIVWNNIKDGKIKALKTKKPSIIVFYADWCPHCKNYSEIFNKPEIINLAKNFIMIKVNTDNEEVDKKFEPDGAYVPRTIFLNKNFQPEYKLHSDRDEYMYFIDYESTNELSSLMKKILKN